MDFKYLMTGLAKDWTGNIFGTNTGNLFIEFAFNEEKINGTLRVNDNVCGVIVYLVSGTFKDNSLKLQGMSSYPEREPLPKITLDVDAILNAKGNLEGDWKTSIETAGKLVAYPCTPDAESQQTQPEASLPEQVHFKNINLGAIRLYLDDLQNLLNEIKKDFTIGRIIVTYGAYGHETMKFSEEFLQDAANLVTLHQLKIDIQEPSGVYGISKMVMVNFGIANANEVRVQGPQEAWVIGKAEKLAASLKPCQNSLITSYKKFGLNLNSIIFFVMLILMPGISMLKDRAIFAVMVFALLYLLLQLHKHFIPIATIKTTDEKLGWFSRHWPGLVSWFGAILASLIVALSTHYFHFFQ